MEISRGGGGGGRDDPGRMTPAQRHDENPERHAGRSQGQNERRENFAAALPSMFSQRATMPMSRAVSSAWIRTPSSKLRLNRSRNATTMVSPGWTGPIRSRQPRAIHGAAAGHVGENQVLAYAVVRIRTSPRARLGWQRGCPTGCASWKSQGKTCGILPSKPWRTAPVATTPCPSTVWSRCWRSWKRPGRRIFSILPSAQGGYHRDW